MSAARSRSRRTASWISDSMSCAMRAWTVTLPSRVTMGSARRPHGEKLFFRAWAGPRSPYDAQWCREFHQGSCGPLDPLSYPCDVSNTESLEQPRRGWGLNLGQIVHVVLGFGRRFGDLDQ